jgi:hypothetical protein
VTWAVVAVAAACLIGSAIAFVTSVHTAAANKRRLATWIGVEHKPAYAFRPEVLGPGVDWIAFGGLGLGAASLVLGAVRIRRERASPYYRIGTAPGVELALEHAPAPAFPLVAPSGDDFVFNYGAGIDGELTVDGTTTPLAELAAQGRSRPSAVTAGAIEVPIPPRARIRARAGQTTFLVSAVARPRRHAGPLLASLERRTVSYLAGSLAVHLGVWGLLQTLPPEAGAVSLELPVIEDAAVPMPLPSGTAGSPDADQRTGRRLVAQIADLPPQMSREDAIRYATSVGVLGSELLRSGVKAMDASELLASGFDAVNMDGGIYGADGGGRGNFGNGTSGLLSGGGCSEEPCGTIGTGRYRTIGKLPGHGGFRIPGHDGVGLPRHTQILPQPGEARIIGSDYSKSIIRRYILRYRDQLSYCYEKQLLARPDLSGQVLTTFFIGTTGVVQSATATGMDPEVAGCIAGVIRTITFPPPHEGVQVNYPFTIRRAG